MDTLLVNIVSNLRARLLVHRSTFPLEINKNINSIETALCLVEFSMDTNPSRSITMEKEKWFNTGLFVDMILINRHISHLFRFGD